MQTEKTEVATVNVLLIEDNPGDIALIEMALSQSNIDATISIAYDGAQALAMLSEQTEYGKSTMPDFVLLDLNLPKMHGHETLERIKNNDALKDIPVIVLSSSAAEGDVQKSHELNAHAHLVKPQDMEQLKGVTARIEEFWAAWHVM